MLDEAGLGWVVGRSLDERVPASGEAGELLHVGLGVHLPCGGPVPEGKGILQQGCDRQGQIRRIGGGLGHLVAAPQQVGQAALVGGECEPAVGGPAVTHDHPGEVSPEHDHRLGVAPAGGDEVDGDPLAHEGPQPCPPARQPVSSGETTPELRTPATRPR